MPSDRMRSMSVNQILQLIEENEERITNEQTDITRAEYRGRFGVTTRTVPSPTDLDVGQFDGTVGSDTLPVPERVVVDVVDGFGNRFTVSGDACPEGSSGVDNDIRISPEWLEMYARMGERRSDMPNCTTTWYAPVTTAGSTTTPYAIHYEIGNVEPEPTPPTPQPEPRVNEIILSDSPVEQYYLTAISFFKGLKAPDGGSGRYGRTHTNLKDSIINALESELSLHKESRGSLPGNHEEDDPRPYSQARGRRR